MTLCVRAALVSKFVYLATGIAGRSQPDN